jgi:TolB-like protein/Tfp pilus assembly protein PilF
MIYKFADCELDIERRELRRAGTAVAIEPQVFGLLCHLVANAGRVVSKDELNEAVWSGRVVSDSALSSRVKSARAAIGDDGKAQSLIRTVHGHGFRFVGTVDRSVGETMPSQGSARETPVVAVMPFENLSGDAKEDYFADGMTADIIATLAKHRWLTVLARNATSRFKGADATVAEIARETGAHYLVEGSVRHSGQRVRVSVQLIDASSGSCIWSERYDRQSEDIFDIQDDITQTVSARIEPEIGYEERRKITSAVGSRDLRAWEWFHLGTSHLFRFSAADNLKAQEYLQKAREQDPDFAAAHAWWAYAVVLGTVYWDTEPSAAQFDEALAATSRALASDSRNAVFYALKARVQLARGEYEGAIEGNRIAIELNPSFAAAYCGLADSLTYLGQCDEAVERFEKAIALSSNDPQRWAFYTYGALAHIFRGDYARAIEWADHAAAIPNRQYWTLAHKAVALALLGKTDEAGQALAAARAEQPALSVSFARRKLYYLKRAEQLDLYLEGLALAGAVP